MVVEQNWPAAIFLLQKGPADPHRISGGDVLGNLGGSPPVHVTKYGLRLPPSAHLNRSRGAGFNVLVMPEKWPQTKKVNSVVRSLPQTGRAVCRPPTLTQR
ncbi:uncharacterized protein LOC101855781 [Aplysia californica]|uniref:Uncharacterized protein LOC101855781 n=1 Tax=Aplysia californica TaxID=6500 RepID=A0ABM0JKD1_APLCA|nr:uncharacterized protein LOC101855781 [Aplysia californica]